MRGSAWIAGVSLVFGIGGVPSLSLCQPSSALESPNEAPKHLRLSLTEHPSSAMKIAWDTVGEGPSLVSYKVDTNGSQVMKATGKTTKPRTSPFFKHEVTLEGLLPDTEYAFSVEGQETLTQAQTFKTASEPGTGRARFAVFGDSRNDFMEFNQDRWKAVADAAAEEPIDFSLHTGDYTLTSVSPFGWEWFFDAGANLFAKAPFMAVRGNHEMYGPVFEDRFSLPGNETFYSFDYGPVHVAVLDTEDRLLTRLAPDIGSVSDFGPGSEQYVWLEQDLQSVPGGMWKVVAFHRPPYSVGEHGDQKDVQALVPLFDRYQVDVVFSGHDHTYQRSKPMVAGKAAEKGTVYIVTAGAGAPLYEVGEADWLQTAVSAFHYVFVDASPETFRIEAKSPDGVLLDTLEIRR